MDHELEVWCIVVTATLTLVTTVQLCFLIAMLFEFRRISIKIKSVAADLDPQILSVVEFIGVANQALANINRVAKDTAEIAERIKPVVDEATDISHRQLALIDQAAVRVLTRIDTVSRELEQCIIQPAREVRALAAALRAAFAVFFRCSRNAEGRTKSSGSPRGSAILPLVLAVPGFFASKVCAQQIQPQVSYDGEHVASVDLVVRPGLAVEALRPFILQKAGEPYSNDKARRSVAALIQTKHFAKVEVEVTPEAGGLRVVFIAQPVFYVGMIQFPGALRVFSYSRLLAVVNYPPQEPYEESRMREAEPALRNYFAENGYFAAEVRSEPRLDEAHQLADLVFHVKLNKRAKLGRVEVTRLHRNDAARLENALRSLRARLKGAYLKRGKLYDAQRLKAATAFIHSYLSRENRLADEVRLMEPHFDHETNRADITFQVTVGPTVAVRVTGARLSKKTLHKLIPIYEENAFDMDLVTEGQRNLVSYFQSKGFFDVKVKSQAQDEPQQVSLVYQIDKGAKHRVRSIKIAGNQKFNDDDLGDQIVVRKGTHLSRGAFSQDLMNRSVKNLAAFYQNAGYADVKVEPEVVDHEPDIDVAFKIVEGKQTVVESLDVEGNKAQTITELAPQGLKLRPGQPFSRTRLDQDQNQIVANYMNLGYLGVDFKSMVTPLFGDSHRVAVTYEITEGPQAKISQLLFLGRQRTRVSLVQKNTSLRPQSPLSEGKMLDSESKLYNLGIFDWASVSPRRPVTSQKQDEVLVRVHEAKRNYLSYGLGFLSTPRSGSLSAGVVALPGLPTVGLPPRFQIIQKTIVSPMGSVEYSRVNLRGLGETASVATQLSPLDQKGSFTYTDPQWYGLDLSALWSLSAERTTQNPLFTARLGSASFQVEKALDAAKTEHLHFRYTFQRTTLTNLLIKNFVLPEDTNVRSSTFSVSFLRDTRDKPLDAHKGVFQSLDFGVHPKAFGSSNDVVRFFGQASFYRQVKPWMVWANNFRLGFIRAYSGSHVPISERFFTGGADSLRGFPLNGAGPQGLARLCTQANDPSSCTASITVPEGGRQLFIFNSEGRFPLPFKKGLGGVIFYDGGNVYQAASLKDFANDYSNSVGFGLRYQTPVGPVRIDIGQNLNSVPGLKSTNLFITLGQSF